MIWKWLVLIALAVMAGSWIVYLTAKAINGILYEAEILRRYLARDDEA